MIWFKDRCCSWESDLMNLVAVFIVSRFYQITFCKLLTSNRTTANELALEAAPVASVVLSFVEEVETWRGTASELLKEISPRAGDTALLEGWAKSPRALSGTLKRLAPNLRACGVEVTHEPRKNKARSIVLEKLCKSSSPSSPSSLLHFMPDLQGETGDDAGDANGESDASDDESDARRNLSSLENASKNGLSDGSDGSDDDLHSFSKSARSEEEAELAALLDYYAGNDRNADLNEGAFAYAPGKFF